MKRRKFLKTIGKSCFVILGLQHIILCDPRKFTVKIQQITHGPNHHFFGYIGQSLTTPWNSTGTRILTLRAAFHDHLPGGDDPADVALVNLNRAEGDFYIIEKVDESLGWNFQQGTMFYWNPDKPASQFFFNDRDPQTGEVFTVLYDINQDRRIREYKFEDTPVGNGGVCPVGKSFLAINYARMARLRPVTGYRGTTDWTEGIAAPEDDGIFIIDIESGEKKLLVSFAQLEVELNKAGFAAQGNALFINHTLWNRDGELVYFYVRANWQTDGERINIPCTINADGTDLVVGHQYIGGHPEWGIGSQIIGAYDDRQVIYDVQKREIIDTIATREAIPSPGGDISLSPNGQWFVNGFSRQRKNYYNIIRLTDGEWVRTRGFNKGEYEGDLRIDPAPRWNRQNNQILVPGVTEDGTRQLFILTITE